MEEAFLKYCCSVDENHYIAAWAPSDSADFFFFLLHSVHRKFVIDEYGTHEAYYFSHVLFFAAPVELWIVKKLSPSKVITSFVLPHFSFPIWENNQIASDQIAFMFRSFCENRFRSLFSTLWHFVGFETMLYSNWLRSMSLKGTIFSAPFMGAVSWFLERYLLLIVHPQ